LVKRKIQTHAVNRPLGLTYSRVSNPNDKREASLESQEEAQVALLESRGFHIPPELRFRERYTGMESIYDRPVLCHIRDLIETGRVQAMSAYDTDRLARDPRHLLTVVADNHKRGVQTLFVKCDHATEGRIGEMILYMKGFASAMEWDAVKDRTMRGRQKILQKGQWVGNGTPKYGYTWNKEERSRNANPDTAPIVRRIFHEIASGASPGDLAAQLTRERIPTPFAYAGRAAASSPWWATTIRKIIKDRVYLGEAKARRYVTLPKDGTKMRRVRMRPASEQLDLDDARTEALVTPAIFEQANRAVGDRHAAKGRPPRNVTHLLTGIIYCGLCGSRMTPASTAGWIPGRATRKITRNYACLARRLKNGPACREINGAGWVEAEAWHQIKEKLLKPGFLEREMEAFTKEDPARRLKADLKAAEARCRKIAKDVDHLVECQLNNPSSKLLAASLAEKLSRLDAEAEELDGHIDNLRMRIEAAGQRERDIEAFLASLGGIRSRIGNDEFDDKEKREIFDALDAKVYSWREGPERHVRVEVPLMSRVVNSDTTITRSDSSAGPARRS
jgi:DNA invertase Pin-like site-specific DNA recombinase